MNKMLVLAIFSLVFCGSCQKNEIKLYEEKASIYFMSSRTEVQFINVAGDTTQTWVRVMTTGSPKDYARRFKVCVDPDSTTAIEGINYLPLEMEYEVPAGKCFVDIPITSYRSDNIRTNELVLGLRLQTSDDEFELKVKEWFPNYNSSSEPLDATYYSLAFSDFVVQPPMWRTYSYVMANGREGGAWGQFTEKKYRLMCEKLGLTYNDMLNTSVMPRARANVIAEKMSVYLERKLAEGDPVLEDDGRLMWFGYVSWTSIVGVPYVVE